MTMHYKVWLEIEEIDESRGHYQTVDTPGGAVASFTDYQDAYRFAEHANEMIELLAAVESPNENKTGVFHATSY